MGSRNTNKETEENAKLVVMIFYFLFMSVITVIRIIIGIFKAILSLLAKILHLPTKNNSSKTDYYENDNKEKKGVILSMTDTIDAESETKPFIEDMFNDDTYEPTIEDIFENDDYDDFEEFKKEAEFEGYDSQDFDL